MYLLILVENLTVHTQEENSPQEKKSNMKENNGQNKAVYRKTNRRWGNVTVSAWVNSWTYYPSLGMTGLKKIYES